jgi:hypothetical protein
LGPHRPDRFGVPQSSRGCGRCHCRSAEYAGRRLRPDFRSRTGVLALDQGSNKPEELNAYLTNYPNGQFKSLALARIASLQDGPSTTTRNLTTGINPATFTQDADQTAEDGLGLDKGQRCDVQRRLTALGFDSRVSGKFDDSTRVVRPRAAIPRPVT